MTTTSNIPRIAPPQAFLSSYAPRLRTYSNALLAPIPPPTNTIPPARTTKRGTTIINYAEDGFGSDIDEDNDSNARRPTGLRSQPSKVNLYASGADRAGTTGGNAPKEPEYGKEATAPVSVQGIWREWMGKSRPAQRTEKQAQTQSLLPLHLVPIRIDLDIAPFRPEAALPAPPGTAPGDLISVYRMGDLTPGFRLKDMFLWNLHEALLTPEQFARVFVEEMDFAIGQRTQIVGDIARQIRDQCEDHARTALHPLFQISEAEAVPPPPPPLSGQQKTSDDALPPPKATLTASTDPADIPQSNPTTSTTTVTATASPSQDPTHNLPDTHRCILTLSIPYNQTLYFDRLEWSLLTPPGHAETFARLTTADLGLPAEYVPQIAHAIYEAVLRLQKEAAENASASTSAGGGGGGNPLLFSTGDATNSVGTGLAVGGSLGFDNEAAREWEGAGWRYDAEGLGHEWGPKLERLSKEEIEKREGDRERRLRRARRETARLAGSAVAYANANANANANAVTADAHADYHNHSTFARGRPAAAGRDFNSLGLGLGLDSSHFSSTTPKAGLTPDLDDPTPTEPQMGRGHRSKKKRRFRSLSPDPNANVNAAADDARSTLGPLSGIGVLSENERGRFRCSHCGMPGAAVWAVRDGPEGKDSLCQVCGWLWERARCKGSERGVEGGRVGMWRGNEGVFAGEGVVVVAGARR